MEFFAHTKPMKDGTRIEQTAVVHCRNTASHSAGCLSDIGLTSAAYLPGLLHDAGKFKEEFQNYLASETARRGSGNHTFAGCRMMLEHFHGTDSERYEDVTRELVAYAIGAHHGLFDCVDEEKKSGFLHRMEKTEMEGVQTLPLKFYPQKGETVIFSA